MNFVRRGFRKLSSDRRTNTTEIIYHAASRVLRRKTKKTLTLRITTQQSILKFYDYTVMNSRTANKSYGEKKWLWGHNELAEKMNEAEK